MRLISLRLQNINSLYGEWNIDFNADEFRNGIFAITGETGSGKTTILDAIMLALFEETPRLKGKARINCVSKHANCCLVELRFAIGEDVYDARFGYESYKATKTNPHPDLYEKSLFHKLAKNGVYETGNNTDIVKKIVDLIGMDAKQFCQTVMLAQGRFNEFLQAEDKEKAAILEKLTETTRYAEIGQEVYRRKERKEGELRELESRMEGMHFLGEEEERETREKLKELAAEKAEREKRQKTLSALLELLGSLDNYRQLLDKNAVAQDALAEERRLFEPEAARLALALKAAKLEKPFQERDDLMRISEQESKALDQLQQVVLPELGQKAIASRQTAEAEQKALVAVKEEGEKLEALLVKVTPLDQDIRALDKTIQESAQRLTKAEADVRETSKNLAETQKRLSELETEKLQSETYLRDHEQDRALPAKQEVWKERLGKLSELRKQESEQGKTVTRLKGELDNANKQEIAAKAALEQALAKLSELEQLEAEALKAMDGALDGSKLEDLERQQDLLEQMIRTIKTMVSYEEERKKLEDGKPCPLCGSIDHPLALGNVPKPDEKEAELRAVKRRIKGYQKAKDAWGKAQAATGTGRLAVSQAKGDYGRFQDATVHLREQKEQAEKLAVTLKQAQDELTQTLCQEFTAFGIHWEGTENLPSAIESRVKIWQTHDEKLNAFERTKAGLQTKVNEETAQADKLTQALQEQIAEQKQRQDKLVALHQERQQLFGDRQVDAERQGQQKRLDEQQQRVNQAVQGQVQAEESLKHKREETQKLTESQQAHVRELELKRRECEEACQQVEMTEEGFREAVLPAEKRQKLVEKQAELETRGKTLVQHQQEWTESLKQAQEKLPEGCDPAGVQEELEQLRDSLSKDNELYGELGQVLKQHESNVKEAGVLRQQQKDLEAQKAVLEMMNSLIGGADGLKFKKFAQRLTLEQLLEAANAKLKRMNPRYALVPCEEGGKQELDIDVIDHEQGGEVRTGKNLSGGEQFMVSLALALGLSSMVGERKPVDFLFLDEGFGTLSGEPLEQAVGMLGDLRQQEGKTIGIISHVPVIGERFPSIVVTKQGEGRSTLSGPGISKISE